MHKCDQIHSFLRISSHLLKKSFVENLIFCTTQVMEMRFNLKNGFPGNAWYPRKGYPRLVCVTLLRTQFEGLNLKHFILCAIILLENVSTIFYKVITFRSPG